MSKLRRLVHNIYPWLVIFLCSLFLFYKYILQVSPSVMTNELMRFFHIHAAGLGNLAATFFYSYLIVQIFAGPLLDKYSPRILMSCALFICAIGTLLFSVSNDLWFASFGRMLVGVGSAFATVGYMKMAAVYFPPKRFAFVGGLLATAAMIGAVLGETPLAYLVKIYGWQQSLFCISIAGLFISVVFYLLVQDKKDTEFLDLKNNGGLHLNRNDFISILKRKHNWMLAFYSGLAFSPIVVFGGLWGNPFLQEAYEFNRLQSSEYVSLIFIGLAVGGPLLGWISDRLINRLGVMIAGSGISLISLILVIYIHLPLLMLSISLFLFGFGVGAFMLGFAMGKDINPLFLAGTVVALINTGDAIFGAVTEPFVGNLLDFFWHGAIKNGVPYFEVATYQKAFSILVAYLFLSLVLALWLTHEKRKNNILKLR